MTRTCYPDDKNSLLAKVILKRLWKFVDKFDVFQQSFRGKIMMHVGHSTTNPSNDRRNIYEIINDNYD